VEACLTDRCAAIMAELALRPPGFPGPRLHSTVNVDDFIDDSQCNPSCLKHNLQERELEAAYQAPSNVSSKSADEDGK
jgi:hypothetical protein